MLPDQTSSTQEYRIVEAALDDYDQLAGFLNQNIRTQRHLDWFSSLDWLGSHPYLIEFSQDKIQAVLCATPENEETAWVRVFGVRKTLVETEHWDKLLMQAVKALKGQGIKRLGALALHPWFEALLVKAGFENHQNVVVLEWDGQLPPKPSPNPEIEIRPMHLNDLPTVENIDQMAFPSLWQNSQEGLTKALSQTGISTVALKDEAIVGYQISTAMTIYGHLARLAVNPADQRQGIAYALVYDLLREFEQRGFWRITVNTQSDNLSSLKLYQKLGFRRTEEEIRVYELTL